MIFDRCGTAYCTQHIASTMPLIPPLTGYLGKDCSSSVNQCVSNPCDPEGTILCEKLENTSRCVCQHGYTGRHCKTPINHCVDGLCQHGSACVNLSGGFKCDCLPGGFITLQGLVSGAAFPWMNHVYSRHTPSLSLLLVQLSSLWESNLFGLKQQHITVLWNV